MMGRMPKEWAWPSSRPPSTGRYAASPVARGAARGTATPEPALLPLVTFLTSPPAPSSSQVLWPILAGVEAAEEAAEGSRRRRSASTRVLRCCVQPGRAAVAGAT